MTYGKFLAFTTLAIMAGIVAVLIALGNAQGRTPNNPNNDRPSPNTPSAPTPSTPSAPASPSRGADGPDTRGEATSGYVSDFCFHWKTDPYCKAK